MILRHRCHGQACIQQEEAEAVTLRLSKSLSLMALQSHHRTIYSTAEGNGVSKKTFPLSGRTSVHRMGHMWCLLLLILSFATPSEEHFVPFTNCLNKGIQTSDDPKRLQFVPLFVNASIENLAPTHNLNITVLGNVTGVGRKIEVPKPSDPQWADPKNPDGKIPDTAGNPGQEKYTTFTTSLNVLDYKLWSPDPSRFCNTSALTPCPWTPVFDFKGNESTVGILRGASGEENDGKKLPAMNVAHDLWSSYAFTSIQARLELKSGDEGAFPIACVQANITPDLGRRLSDTLTYVPLAILIIVALATASAAIFSPWGSTDVFRFTSNYGRDDDLLRLVTPGFGDCLQYLQFVVLAGSLSLNYPGFYQPTVSQVSWSALMFNESFVTKGNGFRGVVDGIYVANASYGLDRMTQLVGMTADKDMWAGMMIWVLVIIAAIVILIQLGFIAHWIYRLVSNTQQEDLRQKNLPFSCGNAIRIVFNYFLLPIVALSCYQLVIASESPGSVVAVAAMVIVILICFAGYLLWLIATTRPRSYLFDDLPTVLLYGPLYNTYSDNAATFALVPVMLTFLRGIAIGAVQPSGIAQLVLLAICEVITILTLNAFRPFHSPTSMNAYHTIFAVMRLLTVLLSVAFLPSLNVGDSPKGWIGYTILLLHGLVLTFGFSLNAMQTLIEVLARLAGAGGEDGSATRGGLVRVFGMRQLSRRNPRRPGRARQSVGSDAAILTQDGDQKSLQWNGTRSRSISASSGILLNKHGTDNRQSMGLDSVSAGGPGETPISGGASAFSFIPSSSQAAGQHSGGGIVNIRETADPYYRPPRMRRTTMEAGLPDKQPNGSWNDPDVVHGSGSRQSPDIEAIAMSREGPIISRRGTPTPAHFGGTRERADSDADDPRRSKTDYATREVDFYYGVRGPALSNQPTRRLKTGPADPTGPVSSASGWIKSLFGGKTKDKGKGFEVVRSSRALPLENRTASGIIVPAGDLPYTDESRTLQPERNRDLALSDEGDAIGAGTRHLPDEEAPSPLESEVEHNDDISISDDDWPAQRDSQISPLPPSLPVIESAGGIELPSRVGSKTSSRHNRENFRKYRRAPSVPRKSSKRDSRTDLDQYQNPLSTAVQATSSTPHRTAQVNEKQEHPSNKQIQPINNTTNAAFHRSQPSAGASSFVSSMYASQVLDGESDHHGHARHSSSVLGANNPQLERPTSLGYVQQHRASDHIHTSHSSLIGSAAELVDAAPGQSGRSEPGVRH